MGWRCLPIAALCFFIGLGCSGRKTVYPVRGKVLNADGKPAVGAMVVFHAIGADKPDPNKPVGRVNEEGEFHVTTYKEGDGAPAGEYGVTIVWIPPKKTPLDPEGSDLLRGSYNDPANPKVKFTVEKKSDNEVPSIQLPK
jgi:hypothetical protein